MVRKPPPAGPSDPSRRARDVGDDAPAPPSEPGDARTDAREPGVAAGETVATVDLADPSDDALPDALPLDAQRDAAGDGFEAGEGDEPGDRDADDERDDDGAAADDELGLAALLGDETALDAGAPTDAPEGDAPDAARPEFPGPARTAPRSVTELHLKGILESLVFVSDKPLTVSDLAKIARAEARDVRRLLDELREEYRGRGVQLDEIAGGWQFRSSAANAPFVRELLQAKPVRLTRAQVETLAIIAYRQPITRPEIDEIRGVDSGSALKVLLERDLVRILGRKEEVGRPVLYGTSGHFLEFFGLKSLRELPTLREFTDLTPESEATLVRELGEAESAAPDAAAPVGTDATPPPPPSDDAPRDEVAPPSDAPADSPPESPPESPPDAPPESPEDPSVDS